MAGVQYENAKPDFPSLEYVLNWRMPHYYKIDTSKLVKNLKAPPEMKRRRGRPRTKLPIDEMVRWYVDEGVSTYAITERLRKLGYRVSQHTVHNRLRERGVVRDRKTAIVKANTKFPKKPFNGDPFLKVYLLGLREDLNIQWNGRRIHVKLGTTHPAMERLFISLFPRWSSGQLYKYPMYAKYPNGEEEYEYISETYLHSTFDFLLKKPAEKYWKWALWAIENHFWDFLAGFIDAEGTIGISEEGVYIALYNKNKGLLKIIREKLQKFGLHPTKVTESDACYRFELKHRSEVTETLRKLPLKHPEKVCLKHLFLSQKFTRKQKLQLYRNYRDYVKREVKKYTKQAEEGYLKSH